VNHDEPPLDEFQFFFYFCDCSVEGHLASPSSFPLEGGGYRIYVSKTSATLEHARRANVIYFQKSSDQRRQLEIGALEPCSTPSDRGPCSCPPLRTSPQDFKLALPGHGASMARALQVFFAKLFDRLRRLDDLSRIDAFDDAFEELFHAHDAL